MRKLMIAGLMGIGFLSGCGAKTTALVIYKEKVSYLDGNQALLKCRVKAAQTVPVSNNMYTTPTWTTPISCSVSSGRTSCSGGITYSGNIITKDSNSGLRETVTEQCLRDKGYFVGEAPICNARNKKKYSENFDIHNIAPDKLLTKPADVLCVFYGDGMPLVVENTIQAGG